jgi:hypothetical protein
LWSGIRSEQSWPASIYYLITLLRNLGKREEPAHWMPPDYVVRTGMKRRVPHYINSFFMKWISFP